MNDGSTSTCYSPSYRLKMKFAVILVFFSAFLGQTLAQTLVMLGGNLNDDNTVIWQKIIQLAGGADAARFGVISASAKPTVESSRVLSTLTLKGVKSVVAIAVPKASASSALIANQIKNLTAVFIIEDSDVVAPKPVVDPLAQILFSPKIPMSPLPEPPTGQIVFDPPAYKRQNLVDTLRPNGVDSVVLTAIKTVLSKGGVVIGNAAIMSKSSMILEGDSMSALVAGSPTFLSFPRTPVAFNKKGGLALLNTSHVIESHLSEKGREVRLMRALIESGSNKGLGVDENTALIITNPLVKPVGEVLTAARSTSGVLEMDLSTFSPVVLSAFTSTSTYEKIPFNFYTTGDSLDLTTGVVTYASWKVAIAGQEWFDDAIPSYDILSRSTPAQWRETARRLIDCKEFNVTSSTPASLMPLAPAVRVYMDRTMAVGYGADIPNTTIYVASYTNMMATIQVQGITLCGCGL